MKSLLTLWYKLAADAASTCSVDITRDCITVTSRSRDEGESFLTITLPKFGKDFDRCLADGRIPDSAFAGFSRKGHLPRFLGGMLSHVFGVDGVLLDEPCIDCLRAVRQLTGLFAKINLPCSDERREAAFEQFVKTEVEVRSSVELLCSQHDKLESFRLMAERLFSTEMWKTQRALVNLDLVPRHGPGKTAERSEGNLKWDFREWPERLESAFPFADYAVPNHRHAYTETVNFTSPWNERPSRIVAVPKTLKAPRIIAIEPSWMQYCQQAISIELVENLETGLYRLVGVRSQDENREFARIGSLTGSVATLDLSEASDRVSNLLVRSLFQSYPTLSHAVQACRSTSADVPLKGEIPLSKFASMGSALTFPVEAMVFATIIMLGIQKQNGHRLSSRDIKRLSKTVRVYGDDIVVPTHYASSVADELEAFGLKVNGDKSFWNGEFRESCGMDAFRGQDVTPVRVRETFPVNTRDARRFVSLVSLRNQLYHAGYWQTAGFLDEKILATTNLYPVVEESSNVLGRHSVVTPCESHGWDLDRHVPLVKGWIVKGKTPDSHIQDIPALAKCLITKRVEPLDVQHLERYGRADIVQVKVGWAAPF